MSELSDVSKTLFVPLLGRAFTSRHYPAILKDEVAESIAARLPPEYADSSGQNEYTFIASAVRSRHVDMAVARFLSVEPNGVIVNVGCGLETARQRAGGKGYWYELDLPEVLSLRQKYLPQAERERFLPRSMFDYSWVEDLRKATRGPYLVIASGLFHYFDRVRVVEFIQALDALGSVRLTFDAVSAAGMKMTRRYMRRMGREDAVMYFHVDDAKALAASIGPGARVEAERLFYRGVPRGGGLSLMTSIKMRISDSLRMVKMIELTL